MKLRAILMFLVMLGATDAFAAKELATVNGKAITDKDMTVALSTVPEGQRQSVMKDLGSRLQVVNKLVDQEVLLQEAEKEKLDQDQEYKDALENFRKQYLSSRVLRQNLSTKLNEAAAKKYYESHKSRYSTDQVHAEHILVSDEKTAKDLLKQAKAPGADFEALAEKNSKDPSAKNNRGDLGFFGREQMVPEFTDAAFGAKDGEIVGPVKTNFGYHIIKVVGRKLGKPLTFDEVELRVKNDLQKDIVDSYIHKLRAEAKVNVDEKAVKSF